MAIMRTDVIRERVVEIEIGQPAGAGWIAVGIVRQGLAPERGLRFEAHGASAEEAERRLREEIEACFG